MKGLQQQLLKEKEARVDTEMHMFKMLDEMTGQLQGEVTITITAITLELLGSLVIHGSNHASPL